MWVPAAAGNAACGACEAFPCAATSAEAGPAAMRVHTHGWAEGVHIGCWTRPASRASPACLASGGGGNRRVFRRSTGGGGDGSGDTPSDNSSGRQPGDKRPRLRGFDSLLLLPGGAAAALSLALSSSVPSYPVHHLLQGPHDTSSMPVCVVIPALNEEVALPATLRCVAALEPPPAAVVVSVGPSTDRTADIAREFGATVVSGDGRRGRVRRSLLLSVAPFPCGCSSRPWRAA